MQSCWCKTLQLRVENLVELVDAQCHQNQSIVRCSPLFETLRTVTDVSSSRQKPSITSIDQMHACVVVLFGSGDVVRDCFDYFGFRLPSVLIAERSSRFLAKLAGVTNMFCASAALL